MNITSSLAMAASLLILSVAAHAQTATDIVAASDNVRNPRQPFRATVTFTEYTAGKEQAHEALALFSKEDSQTHQFRNVIQYLEPPRDAGKRVLLDGRSLWFYDPASKTSVRISPQQRLIGQAAVGDVLTVNLVVDYSASLIGEETIQDAARTERHCWHVELHATNDRAVYNHIDYWVEKGSFFPIKGKLYSDSGRLLKIIYFRKFTDRLGAVRPTEEIIIDAVDASLATTATFSDQAYLDIPDAWFQREYLPRLDVP
jgi:outer membrane lipoprotein-sorting protein